VLDASSVTPAVDADVITFTVTHPDQETAARLATAYARQFGAYRHGLDAASIEDAQAKVASELKRLDPRPGSATYNYLLEKSQQLQSLQVFQTPNSYVVPPGVGPRRRCGRSRFGTPCSRASSACSSASRSRFLVETLDTRVRSVDEIRDRLGLRVLARIPTFRRRQPPVVMLGDPWSPQAEAFRTLRINLDLMNFQRHAKKIMVAGAQHDEGKSTTAANLAVALARAGRSVALVDCDLHQPTLHRLFGIEPTVGLTDVLLGDVPLERALVAVDVGESAAPSSPTGGNGSSPAGAVVQVLPGGHARVEEKLVAGERIGRVAAEPRIARRVHDRRHAAAAPVRRRAWA
jgi:hypothetical protein